MSIVKHRQRKFKQMALEVGVRNPERYEKILKILAKFENSVLDDKNILNIYSQLYVEGAIEWQNVDSSKMSVHEIQERIKKINKHQNEWGFPTGYQAAFTRYLKTLSEFGFVYSQYNQKLLLSPMAKLVVNDQATMSDALAIQSFKFWRKSPYRRVLNDFNFFEFIYKVLLKLESQNKKLSLPQFMISLFSDSGDVDLFLELISNNKIGNDFKKAYELIKRIYPVNDGQHDKVSKIQTAFNDYGNTVFRVLRLTGLVNVTYSGAILISINQGKINFINQMLSKKYSISDEEKENELLYFNKIGKVENYELTYINKEQARSEEYTKNYSEKMIEIIKTYNLNKKIIEKAIISTVNGRDKSCFSFIPDPIRFEFLLTLYCYMCYGKAFNYQPNYKCDEYGIPYSHAPGNMGDIVIFNNEIYWLIEATLIRNKTQQINNETVNLFRHISNKNFKEKYLELVAPYIHQDTEKLIKAVMLIAMSEQKDSNLFCKSTKVDDFINECKNQKNISVIKEHSKNTLLKVKSVIDAYKIN